MRTKDAVVCGWVVWCGFYVARGRSLRDSDYKPDLAPFVCIADNI